MDVRGVRGRGGGLQVGSQTGEWRLINVWCTCAVPDDDIKYNMPFLSLPPSITLVPYIRKKVKKKTSGNSHNSPIVYKEGKGEKGGKGGKGRKGEKGGKGG